MSARRATPRKRAALPGRTGAALLLAIVAAGCARPEQEAVVASSADGAQAPAFANLAPEVRYVGEAVCRECHLDIYGTSSRTGMGRAFYPMSAAEAVEDFAANNEFVVPGSELRYRMVEREGKFYQQQFMVDSRGAQIAFDEREMVWVLGSNHHARSYVLEQGGSLFQGPACWYPDESKWELCPGYEFKNDHFSREVTAGCITCHNGVMRLLPGERSRYEEPYPHGIGCERCHGPGELHVARWRGSEVPTGDADPTIVHPRRLPQAERIDVCFQCHLGDAKASERVIRWDREFTLFRPGQRLSDFIVAQRYQQQTQSDFGLSSQADRLIQSRCFKESGGKIECLTCHNPHVTVYHEQRPADFFRRRCLSCHAAEDCAGDPAARAATTPAADDCVRCHMRSAEPDDQRFTTFTDHWIRRDIDIEERDHRTRFDVEPIYPEIFARFPPSEQAFYRGRAQMLLGMDVPLRQQPPIWVSAEGAFEQAIAGGFDNVHSQFFLGKTRSFQGRHREARAAFEAAHNHDPAHHDAAYAYGQELLRVNDLEGALGVFRGMLEQDPDDAMALAELGRTLGMQGQHEQALAYYDRALRAEPWQASLHLNRGRVLAAMGRFDEAARAAREVVRLDPDNAESWFFYQKSHEAAGLEDAAAEGRRFVERLSRLESVGG